MSDTIGYSNPRAEPSPESKRRLGRWLRIIALSGLLLILGIFALDFWIDEPVRRAIERQANQRLDGYSVRVGKADFSPWNFSLDLLDTVLRQDANPEPVVLALPRSTFSVAWRELLRGRLVADLDLEEPRAYVDLVQIRAENEDSTDIEDRGWQGALEEAYPLEIQRFTVDRGSLTYVDDDPDRPLLLTELDAEIRNIRNIRSPERVYPSSFDASAALFGEGRVEAFGRADFLAEPVPTVLAAFDLEQVPLEALGPVLDDYRLFVEGGRLDLHGRVETTSSERLVEIAELIVDGVRVDYVSDPELTEEAVEAVSEPAEEVGASIHIASLRLADAELGFVDRSREPDYRVFVDAVDLRLADWSNVSESGASELSIDGRFMGVGELSVDGTFRPDRDGADLDLRVEIDDTELATMNDLLRAWAGVDVVGGSFAFYSEIEIAEGRIDGYVKPIFSEVDAYSPRQDRDDNVFQKLWQGLVEQVSKLLENEPRDEVVTIADLEGSVEHPDASNLQVVVNLIRNAFIEAILPGFAEQSGLG